LPTVSPRKSARRDGVEHLLDPLFLFNSTRSSSYRSLLHGGRSREEESMEERLPWEERGGQPRGKGEGWPSVGGKGGVVTPLVLLPLKLEHNIMSISISCDCYT
jgi:hypothetical protein